MMPSLPNEQNNPQPQTNPQNTCSKKHKKDNFCAITINGTSPPMMRYIGLENQGATCYLNTVLQILFMTEEFREAVERYVMNNSSSTINNHIAQLFECLKSGERNTATTEGITAELKINVHKQEDAAKCLQKILNKVAPEISKIFQGRMAQTTICMNPAKEHEPLKQVKTFFILSISLNSEPPVHMQKCFDSYFAPIIMYGEDQEVYCKGCETTMKTTIISSLQEVPYVLVLHLERFEFDYDTMCCVKNYSSVQIPLKLFVKEEAGVNHTYDLYAIANHSGSLNGGHYYADIKDENGWCRFDDSVVNRLEKYLKRDSDVWSDEAYLLLYKKCSKSKVDTFSVVSETESPKKKRKRAKTPPEDHLKSVKIRKCSEHDSQSTESNEQNHLNNSDSNSETEAHASKTMPTEPGPDKESLDADQNQPTTNNSSFETDCQFSGSECEKGKVQQDLQSLQKNSDSNSETEAHTSQNVTDDPTLEHLQSIDGDNGNQLKLLPSSAGQVSTGRALMKYFIGMLLLSLLVFLILFLISYYCPPHLLIFSVAVHLITLICLLLLLAIFVVSYLLPTMFTRNRNYESQHSGVI
ncbi:ubiquitin carboxyl-terminal hydrolase 7-like isoform X2 [Carassius carassius]|nr:ubiquitin carboxyl-terminal hydrolase 7-like isoform X2 [Carassius carassius]